MILDIRVDKKEVDLALINVRRAISPNGLALFHTSFTTPYLRQQIGSHFDKQGWSGGAWERLALFTQERRRSLGYHPSFPINIRSGEMYNFLVHQAAFGLTVDGVGVTYVYPGTLGDDLMASKITVAQKGGMATHDSETLRTGNRKTRYRAAPARPVMELTPGDATAIVEALNRFIIERMAQGLVRTLAA